MIFIHDSAWATEGVGAEGRNNNPCNVRCLNDDQPYDSECVESPGNGYFAKFPDLTTGVRSCVDLYTRRYSGKPWKKLVWEWARVDCETNPEYEYCSAVQSCFQ